MKYEVIIYENEQCENEKCKFYLMIIKTLNDGYVVFKGTWEENDFLVKNCNGILNLYHKDCYNGFIKNRKYVYFETIEDAKKGKEYIESILLMDMIRILE